MLRRRCVAPQYLQNKSMSIFIKVRSTVTINERYFGATHLSTQCLVVSANIKVLRTYA